MPHLDRLRELVYVSPSGKEFRPLWDTLERSGGKKSAIHEIPQANTADVQDLGNQGDHWPLALYFVGPDYDQIADKFYAALREKGRAKLRHPRWGNLDVLPLTWSQSEDLVDGLRAASFKVDFIHAPDISALSETTGTAAAIQSAADVAATAASVATSAQMVSRNATDLARLKSQILKSVRRTTAKLKAMSASVDETRRGIEATGRAIERGIDTLVETPLALAQSIVSLARAPARLATSINAKLDGYASLLSSTVSDALGLTMGAAAASCALDILSLICAASDAVTVGTLLSRSAAVNAHGTYNDALAQAQAMLEYLQSQGYVHDTALLALIEDLKARAAAYLLESAYSLPAERILVLSSARTPLDLAYELLGDPDRMSDLITLNSWGGDMLLVLPIGSEVRYYA